MPQHRLFSRFPSAHRAGDFLGNLRLEDRPMSTPNWTEIEADRDRAESLPECDWTTETPETEAAVKASGSTFGIPLRETSRRLERQRNGLYQLLNRRAGQ